MKPTQHIRPFHTVLIANRGEIALRILRSVHDLGYGSVAVYSDADRDSPHVHAAHRAVYIGAASPHHSYLNINAIINAARLSGADAIHPGYGFLAENAEFADAVCAAGLVFIGPTGEAIRAMGDKAEAKRLLQQTGMPCIPGYQESAQDLESVLQAAQSIGFPLMIKASAGGGGRGMRLVEHAAEFEPALSAAKSEAASAFGSDRVILERAVSNPRHIEIQILADSHGHCIHLGERDCSIQRRHQKIIEEAPSPAVDATLRAKMGAAAIQSAQAIGYIGAGTMEFLLDPEGQFYFMEMNTRLQVEHAITEAITGIDLVAWQLRIAAGERLSLQQSDIQFNGHAIEVRLTAEDVPAGFLPQTGTVLQWEPAQSKGIRIDHCIQQGTTISPYYDSMIAKLIAHGNDREMARRKLDKAVSQTVLLGLPSNQGFLIECLNDPVFVAGNEITTRFVLDRFGTHPGAHNAPSSRTIAYIALGIWTQQFPTHHALDQLHLPTLRHSQNTVGRLNLSSPTQQWHIVITAHEEHWQVQCIRRSETDPIDITHTLRQPRWQDSARTHFSAECDGLLDHLVLARDDKRVHALHENRVWIMELQTAQHNRQSQTASGDIRAPMTGRIVNVAVQAGDTVQAGQTLLVLEAMKMEYTLTAPLVGMISELHAQQGGQTSQGALLLRIKESL